MSGNVSPTEASELTPGDKLVRKTLQKHIIAGVEPSTTSQIQAAKLLLEYIFACEIAQIREEICTLREKLHSLGVEL
jgi:hypothetical protein